MSRSLKEILASFSFSFKKKKILIETAAMWLLIIFFSAAYLGLTWRNYFQFATSLDLAAYSQALFNLSHWRLPFDSFKSIIMWGDHAHFILVFLAPFYRLWPDARLLLTVQVLAVTTAGWPVYRAAKKLTGSTTLSLSVLYAYLAFIGTQYALNDDFHPSVLTGAVICWLMYGLIDHNDWLYWIAFTLGLITREDAPTILFMVGVYILLQRHWKLALLSMAIAASYFLLVAYVVMPIWSPGHGVLLYLDNADKSVYGVMHGFWEYPVAILQNTFDTPEKVSTSWALLASFSFLPLLSPLTYLGAAPILYARFNNSQDYRWLINNYSNANILPILVFGALLSAVTILSLIHKWHRLWLERLSIVILSLLFCLGTLTAWRDPSVPLRALLGSAMPDVNDIHEAQAFAHVIQLIPATDGVSTTAGILSHLPNRQNLQNYPDINSGTSWIVLSSQGNPWPLTRDKVAYAIKQLQHSPDYFVMAHEADIWLFRRRLRPS